MTLIASGSIENWRCLTAGRVPPSSSYSCACPSSSRRSTTARAVHERRARSACPRTTSHSTCAHWPSPWAVTRPTSRVPFSGSASGNTVHAADHLRHVRDEEARGLAREPRRSPSTSTCTDIGFARAAFSPSRRTRRDRSCVLAVPIDHADHPCVEPDSGHDREVLAVHDADVEIRACAVERDRRLRLRGRSGCRRSSRRGWRCRRASTASVTAGAGERVDASLHAAVAAPHDDEVGAFLHCLAARACRPSCSTRPRTTSGSMISCSSSRRRSSVSPPPIVFLRVGDDRDALHAKSCPSARLPRSRSHSATRKARMLAAITHTMPSAAPARRRRRGERRDTRVRTQPRRWRRRPTPIAGLHATGSSSRAA